MTYKRYISRYDKMPSLAASFTLKGEGQNLHFSDISQGFFARFISVDLCTKKTALT
jgi:hypothetical protein